VAYNPKVLLPFSYLGETDELRVQDASCLTARGERVSFWELQVLQEAHLCSNATCMHVELVEEDASCLAARGERVSFWELQATPKTKQRASFILP